MDLKQILHPHIVIDTGWAARYLKVFSSNYRNFQSLVISNRISDALFDQHGFGTRIAFLNLAERKKYLGELMTLRIQRCDTADSTIFVLKGRIQSGQIKELQSLFDSSKTERLIVLDLKEVRLVDRDVVAFLARCERAGILLKDCPEYIREWISGI